MPPIPFAVNSYQSRSLPLSSQRLLNLYLEREPKDAKSQVPLFGVPGLVNFSTCGNGPVRGLYNKQEVAYAVSGDGLYTVAATGAATKLGDGIAGSNFVSITDNGAQLNILTGSQAYLWSQATGLISTTPAMVAAGFAPGNTSTFFDDYFVYDMPNTNRFFLSGLLDGTVFNGLDFASAEVNPDNIVATLNIHELLLIFGTQTIETWYDAGALNFPFQRFDGGTIQRGCLAPFTILIEDNSAFFLGNDLIFYRLDGVTPRRVSQHAIEDAWAQYGDVTDAFCFSYTLEGHKFLVLTFPSVPHTWVYDISSGLWHERESWNAQNLSLKRWRGNCHAYCYAKHLIGDAFNGTIGYLDVNTYSEYGNKILGQAISAPIHADRKRVFMSRFELDMETGTGVPQTYGHETVNPQVMLDWSDDGGRTYSKLQRWNTLGLVGEYLTRLRWLRMGQFRQRVLRVNISDPVKRIIINAHADLGMGM